MAEGSQSFLTISSPYTHRFTRNLEKVENYLLTLLTGP